jgi:hypothetical protein
MQRGGKKERIFVFCGCAWGLAFCMNNHLDLCWTVVIAVFLRTKQSLYFLPNLDLK